MGGIAMLRRWNQLSTFKQRFLLYYAILFLAATIAYPIASSQKGLAYYDSLLLYRREEHADVYAGRLGGEGASFTVTDEGAVTFRQGDETYGPYLVRKDPTAAPDAGMTGVEVSLDGQILFRGTLLSSTVNSGLLLDESGEVVPSLSYTWDGADAQAPPLEMVIHLVLGPTLSHPGDWLLYGCASFLVVLGVLAVLFDKALFRHNAAWYVADADKVRPSEWYLFRYWMSCFVLGLFALILYLSGLFHLT